MLDTEQQLNRTIKTMLAAIFLLGGTAVAWATLVPIKGAVLAQVTALVDGNVKKIQHQAGGIIGLINVKNGSLVKAGDVVARLDETATRANLAIIQNELTAHLARQARLIAERDNISTVTFPTELLKRSKADAETQAVLQSELGVFDTRNSARNGQKSQLGERIGQLSKELDGLAQQLKSNQEQLSIAKKEYERLLPAFLKGLVPAPRMTALEREIARLEGIVGDAKARMAQTSGRIKEVEIQISQIDRERSAEANKDLRETETRIGELQEKRVAAEDQLRRIDIKAPSDGLVHELNIHTIGGIVTPADVLMQIVPSADNLVFEAKVMPNDIDQVTDGQSARLRFTSFNQRVTPELHGTVISRSGTTSRDQQTGLFYYTVMLRLNEGERAKLGNNKLIPGMMADAFITTDERTVMSFLFKPLWDNFERVFPGR